MELRESLSERFILEVAPPAVLVALEGLAARAVPRSGPWLRRGLTLPRPGSPASRCQ